MYSLARLATRYRTNCARLKLTCQCPPEFEDVLEVQVLGYRERLTMLHGHRLHVLDPVWTLVAKDR